MSSVKSRPVEEFLKLVPLRDLNDLLERHKIGGDSSYLAIDETDSSGIA